MFLPGVLRARPWRSGRNLVLSAYNTSPEITRKPVRTSIYDAKVDLSEGIKGSDFDDLMEHFDVLAVLSMDTNSFAMDMTWGQQDLVNYYTANTITNPLGDYADFLQEQLSSSLPSLTTLTQDEFLALITLTESYDPSGNLYYVADIDVPVPNGYSRIQVRLSEVV